MKSNRQQKRKRGDVSKDQDECICVNEKEPANGIGQGTHSSLESILRPHVDPPIQMQIPSAKMKLQLFPIDAQTRQGLEKDGCNPFLELSLSARKRISSVVRHLNTKWGCSSTVAGQLMLFPYNTKFEHLSSCRRWTLNDSSLTVWEVYVDVGSPSIFRLRYGWLCNHQLKMADGPPKSSLLEAHTGSEGKVGSPRKDQLNEFREAIKKQGNANETLHSDANELNASDVSTGLGDKVTLEDDPVHPTVPWDDNLTILSVGEILSEISMQRKINGSGPSSASRSGLQPIALSSDISIPDLLSEASLLGKMRSSSMKLENESSLQPLFLGSSDISMGGLFSEASLLSNKIKSDPQSIEAGHAQIQSPWDDNFTTLSIGGLFSEASLQAKIGDKLELKESKSMEPFAPSQSLDFFISAQLYAPFQKPKPSLDEPNLSILDAEETCHAFSIQKLQSRRDATTSNARVGSGGDCSNDTNSQQCQFPKVAKINNGIVFPKDSSCQGAFDGDSSLWPFKQQSGGGALFINCSNN